MCALFEFLHSVSLGLTTSHGHRSHIILVLTKGTLLNSHPKSHFFTQSQPPLKLSEDDLAKLTSRIQNAGTEVSAC